MCLSTWVTPNLKSAHTEKITDSTTMFFSKRLTKNGAMERLAYG